jgi:hypothetical protein
MNVVSEEKNIMATLLKEVLGHSDVSSVDYKSIENTTKDRIDFQKVRGSVRLMANKIKTVADVDAMRKAFIALRIP